ncbi:anti-phage ZorAB system protein ZorA [Salinarimonas rosea]|uniref:anti-phage ZorAB system protein ZorA n=1 Tax=Salinarimonas rosea TaxID=552063 RepID=UPI00041875EA|nr:anti-phage ZorAB system protein ZorA [Salinarimonas rosea]
MFLFTQGLLWTWPIRAALFLGLVGGVVYALALVWPVLDARILVETLDAAMRRGEIEGVSRPQFVFALAAGIAALAAGLAAAYLVMHALLLPLAVAAARGRIARHPTTVAFAEAFPAVSAQLGRHPLLGHAWSEFAETLVEPREPGGVYRNTVRPSAFFNLALARERLFGLKMMGAIPGWFVGVGLLLTFVGLVLALAKAGAAASADDADAMQRATRELLQVATFKFATSIAGLGCSIALSILFRVYTIWMEGAFDAFCRAVEKNLLYAAPQAQAAEMTQLMRDQAAELKAINSEAFFARMGESLAPRIDTAFASAIAPVTSSIDTAMERLAASSESGVSDLVEKFTQSVQGGAGAELRELAGALQALQGSLGEVQRAIGASGVEFETRMIAAAGRLDGLVSAAGATLGENAQKSQAAMTEVLEAIRETMAGADARIGEALGSAADGASGRLEAAMARVLERLEAQAGEFGGRLGAFGQTLSDQLDQTRDKAAEAQAAAAAAVAQASAEAAKALRDGLADAMEAINAEVERFAAAIRDGHGALAEQVRASGEVAAQSRAAAAAFGSSAREVEAAAAPFAKAGEQIAGASERVASDVARSVETLEAGRQAAQTLAEALTRHNEQLARTWSDYAARFEGVDRSLAEALKAISEASAAQGEVIAGRVREIDEAFAKAIDKLGPSLETLGENVDRLGEDVEALRDTFGRQAAE